MKELNEYKKEIFTRSTERIKKRKRVFMRNMTLCVVLCFVLGIGSVLLIPPMLTVNEDASAVEDNMDGCSDADGAEAVIPDTAYAYVEVTGLTETDDAKLVTHEPYMIAQLEEFITDAFLDKYPDYDISKRPEHPEVLDESHVDYSQSENVTENKDHITLTLTTRDGYKKTFVIKDSVIIDPELHMDITLTETRLEELKANLGLSD